MQSLLSTPKYTILITDFPIVVTCCVVLSERVVPPNRVNVPIDIGLHRSDESCAITPPVACVPVNVF